MKSISVGLCPCDYHIINVGYIMALDPVGEKELGVYWWF